MRTTRLPLVRHCSPQPLPTQCHPFSLLPHTCPAPFHVMLLATCDRLYSAPPLVAHDGPSSLSSGSGTESTGTSLAYSLTYALLTQGSNLRSGAMVPPSPPLPTLCSKSKSRQVSSRVSRERAVLRASADLSPTRQKLHHWPVATPFPHWVVHLSQPLALTLVPSLVRFVYGQLVADVPTDRK